MRVKKLLQNLDIPLRLLLRTRRDWMAWHWNRERHTLGVLKVMLARLRAHRKVRSVRTTPGNIFLNRAAAASALGLPPSRQSSNSNSGWRTGFEKETLPESTSVILRIPQPWHARQKKKSKKRRCHVTHHEGSRNVASKSSSAKQQAPCLCDLLQVEGRENPPAHQFEIKVNCLIREPIIHLSSDLPRDQRRQKQTFWDPSSEPGLPPAHPAFPARSFPIRPRSACLRRRGHRVGHRSGSKRHRRASIVRGRSASPQDVRRGCRQGGCARATLGRKLAQKGRENR